MKTSFKIAIALVTLTCGAHQLFCMEPDDSRLIVAFASREAQAPTPEVASVPAPVATPTPEAAPVQQDRFAQYRTAFRSVVSTGESATSTAKRNFMSNVRGLRALGLTGIAGVAKRTAEDAAHTAQDAAHAARDLAVQTREKIQAMDPEQRKALVQKVEIAGFVTAALACLYFSKNKPQQPQQ